MKKSATILLAGFCFLASELLPCLEASGLKIENTGRSSGASRLSTMGNSSGTAVRSKTAKKKSTRRRSRRYSPWKVSSYGNPTADDNAEGEDPLVREAAAEALGNLNGALVVVDPNTGRILSIVNQKLALESGFTPCSTFKPIVGLAALKEGLITSETRLRVGRRTRMDLTKALAESNNTFFMKLGRMLGFKKLTHYAHAFGLGEKVGWNIPGETPGQFPKTAPKEGGVGLLSSHGRDISVTPLQLAAMISAIANGGTLYYLQYPRTPEELDQFEPKVRRQFDSLTDYLPQIKEGLAAAVLYGTAQSAFDPEEQIYGKTGTCSEDGARLGWFASFANQQEPKYVVVVLLRGGKQMAGPYAAEIAARVYRSVRQREAEAAQAAPSQSSASEPLP